MTEKDFECFAEALLILMGMYFLACMVGLIK